MHTYTYTHKHMLHYVAKRLAFSLGLWIFEGGGSSVATHCRSWILMRKRTRKLLLFLSRGHPWTFRLWGVDREDLGYNCPWV